MSAAFLTATEAARRLGISAKALKLYERSGLVAPVRTAAGWRAYGPDEMRRAAEVAALRALGFSLAQVARVLSGDLRDLAPALAAHQDVLDGQVRKLAAVADRVRALRDDLARGRAPASGALAQLAAQPDALGVAFDLPWPWGGERSELGGIRPLTYITGPLGSGKTRLAMCIAQALPNAAFIGLERGPASDARIDPALAWIVEEGGAVNDALIALLAALQADGPDVLVIDMLEQGLDEATQMALAAYLRRRGPGARPLFVLTRSSAILDLEAVGQDEAILYCPANHSAPFRVAPYPGSPGFEAVAMCLAPPDVRARTAGVVAMRA